MKKSGFIIIGFATLLIACLTGCNINDYAEENSVSFNTPLIDTDTAYKAERLARIEKDNLFVITDDKTGVQYIIYSEFGYRSGAGGITPRYNADGTLYIDPEWNGEASEE